VLNREDLLYFIIIYKLNYKVLRRRNRQLNILYKRVANKVRSINILSISKPIEFRQED
jgi:hypothetical protein